MNGRQEPHILALCSDYKYDFTRLAKMVLHHREGSSSAHTSCGGSTSWVKLGQFRNFRRSLPERGALAVCFVRRGERSNWNGCLGRDSAEQCWAEQRSMQKLLRVCGKRWRDDDDGLSGGVPLQVKCPQRCVL